MTLAAGGRPAGVRAWRVGWPVGVLALGLAVASAPLLAIAIPVSETEKPGPPAGIFGRIAQVGRAAARPADRPGGSPSERGVDPSAGARWTGLFPAGGMVVKGSPPSLRVFSRGQAPGRLLRRPFRPDPRTLVVRFQGSLSVEAEGFCWPEFPLPGVRAVFRLESLDRPLPGGLRGRWVLSEVGLDPGSSVSSLLAGPLEKLLRSPRVLGAAGRVAWDTGGLLKMLSVSFPGPGGKPARETNLFDGVLAGFPPLWPSVPVGVGASWESVQDLRVDAHLLRTTLGYRVEALRNDDVRVGVALRSAAGRRGRAEGPGAVAGAGVAVDASGSLLWNLQSPFPSEGSLQGQASFPLAWDSGGTTIRGKAILKFSIGLGSG